MCKLLVTLIPTLLLVSACSTTTNTATNDDALQIVKDWSPTLTWSTPMIGTNDEAITIDEDRSIPTGAMQTKSISAEGVSASNFESIFSVSRKKLTASMEAAGWSAYLVLDADGPTGTQFGYRLDKDESVRFLIITATGTDCETSEDAPIQCSTFTAKASLTDTLMPGDDM